MPSVTVPTEREQQIMRDNYLDPKNYGVLYRDNECIRLLCYGTRDMLTIWKGDRKW